jgi:hypothetical protein
MVCELVKLVLLDEKFDEHMILVVEKNMSPWQIMKPLE